jgi:hypothetical protein
MLKRARLREARSFPISKKTHHSAVIAGGDRAVMEQRRLELRQNQANLGKDGKAIPGRTVTTSGWRSTCELSRKFRRRCAFGNPMPSFARAYTDADLAAISK